MEPESAEGVAEGLHQLWQNPERMRDLGHAAAQGVRTHYTVARMAERALEVYSDLIRNFSPQTD